MVAGSLVPSALILGVSVGVVFSDVAVDGEIPMLNPKDASSRCSKRITLRKTYMESWKIPIFQ